jgi:hypothetical protein
MDQPLRGRGNFEQRVTGRRHLAQALADDEQDIGIADAGR